MSEATFVQVYVKPVYIVSVYGCRSLCVPMRLTVTARLCLCVCLYVACPSPNWQRIGFSSVGADKKYSDNPVYIIVL